MAAHVAARMAAHMAAHSEGSQAPTAHVEQARAVVYSESKLVDDGEPRPGMRHLARRLTYVALVL